LRSADERSGLGSDRAPQSRECPAGVWRQENKGFFGFVGNGDVDSFLMDRLGPGIGTRKSRFRRRVRRAAQKGHNHHVVDGLAVRKIGMYPQAVSGLKIRDLRNGERLAGALHADIDLGTDEVKGNVLGRSTNSRQRNDDPGKQGDRDSLMVR